MRVFLLLMLAGGFDADVRVFAQPTGPATQPAVMPDLKGMIVDELTKSQLPSLSVVIVAHDEIVLREVVGDAGRSPRRPATPESIYQIGSMTKVFTAALLVALRERGVVTLDDPVDKYLPDGVTLPADPRGEGRIRLWHLATHTSGLPRLPFNLGGIAEDPYAGYSRERLWEGLGQIRLVYPTGGGDEYSNLGMALLGQVLANAAGKPYEDLVRDELLVPLAMDDSAFVLTDAQKTRSAHGHDSSGKPVLDWTLAAIAPAGGLYSTADDMATFVRWQLKAGQAGVTPLSGGALRRMQSPHAVAADHKAAFGLGWVLKSGPAGTGDIVWHNGMTGGHASWTGLAPEMGVGVVVLTNAAKSVDALGEKLLKQAIGTWGTERQNALDAELMRVTAALGGFFAMGEQPGLSDHFAPEFLGQIPVEQVQAMFAKTGASLGACRGVTVVPGNTAQDCTAAYLFDDGQQMNIWIAIDAGRPGRIVGLRMFPPVKVEKVEAAAKG